MLYIMLYVLSLTTCNTVAAWRRQDTDYDLIVTIRAILVIASIAWAFIAFPTKPTAFQNGIIALGVIAALLLFADKRVKGTSQRLPYVLIAGGNLVALGLCAVALM